MKENPKAVSPVSVGSCPCAITYLLQVCSTTSRPAGSGCRNTSTLLGLPPLVESMLCRWDRAVEFPEIEPSAAEWLMLRVLILGSAGRSALVLLLLRAECSY